MRHEIQPEEVMAYLDGELSAKRAAAAADHLSRCAECQSLGDDFRLVSQRLNDWTVEEVSATVAAMIDGQPIVRPRGPRRRFIWWLAPVAGLAGLACLLLLV